ncbi:MAG TPA: hypothetical protein VFF67_00865 [Thermoplasmata archaeon]|nr:hypothetical protein [Thermoplasmata archaeon]
MATVIQAKTDANERRISKEGRQNTPSSDGSGDLRASHRTIAATFPRANTKLTAREATTAHPTHGGAPLRVAAIAAIPPNNERKRRETVATFPRKISGSPEATVP